MSALLLPPKRLGPELGSVSLEPLFRSHTHLGLTLLPPPQLLLAGPGRSLNDEADIGIFPGLGIPCQLPGNTDDREKSHVSYSPSATPIQMNVHTLTQAFGEGSDVAEWPLAHVTTS